MKFIFILIVLAMNAPSIYASTDLYSFKVNSIDGVAMNLQEYKGSVVILTNIATRCGYTPQLKSLEAVYQKYKAKGLVVVGLPSNDFGGQTPEVEKKVKSICLLNYGVTFPLTEKIKTTGASKHPLVNKILSMSKNKSEIKWNFEKFIIGKKGQLLARFPSSEKPDSKKIATVISKAL